MGDVIYLDNASTALVDCVELGSQFNTSSPHRLGLMASRELEDSRKLLADILGVSEIYFTSGGTESNNLGIIGFASANKREDLKIFCEPYLHPSAVSAVKHTANCEISATALENAKHHKGKQLVILSQVCHETGSITNIEDLARSLKSANPSCYIFVDGVQGFCKEPINLSYVDVYTCSSHKIGALSGAGLLYIRKGLRISPLFYGGGQENDLRPGTHNLRAISSFASTAERLRKNDWKDYVSALKDRFITYITTLPDVFINTRADNVSPYILNVSFMGVRGEILVNALSEKGVYASMGAACRTRKNDKSPLELMDFDRERAEAAVRFSFSHKNTLPEIEKAGGLIIDLVHSLRRVLGRKK